MRLLGIRIQTKFTETVQSYIIKFKYSSVIKNINIFNTFNEMTTFSNLMLFQIGLLLITVPRFFIYYYKSYSFKHFYFIKIICDLKFTSDRVLKRFYFIVL